MILVGTIREDVLQQVPLRPVVLLWFCFIFLLSTSFSHYQGKHGGGDTTEDEENPGEGGANEEKQVYDEGNTRPGDQAKPEGNTRPEVQQKTEENTHPEDKETPEGSTRPEDQGKQQGRTRPEIQETNLGGRPSGPLPVEQLTPELLPEIPLTATDIDRFHFDAYAKVLAEKLKKPGAWPVAVGIYATWGSGKSSLLNLILEKLATPQPKPTLSRRFCRWVVTSIPIVYALCVIIVMFFERCVPACLRWFRPRDAVSRVLLALSVVRDVLLRRKACCRGNSVAPRNKEAPQNDNRHVDCIVAEFDAWLYSDSDALWAILISDIFAKASSIDTVWIQFSSMHRIFRGVLSFNVTYTAIE